MTVRQGSARLPVALLTYIAWTLVTVFGMRWAGDGSKKPLIETVSHGVSWNLVMAIAVLAAVTAVMRWRDLGFVAPRSARSLAILWFPGLYLVAFALLPALLGMPPLGTLLFIALNTALVGLSEEWMFRGVVFQGLRSRLTAWPAIVGTSLLFGGVHVMNVFVTGRLLESAVQSGAAFMSGVVFIALLIRTGSIWVPIAYHALWDLGTFVASSGAPPTAAPVDFTQGWTWAMPMAAVLPNFLYALFLLRGVGNDTPLPGD
ncbi:hypothetical protein TBR22_A01300 [Luteitalea sp. TBR-22]|uniref:CPBP family intramembrane glutamic endopeptidase n=1 Tax=Luteitalea sp. TBR-22 TaxID=2802971 RepID=UPI001AF87283|nr:CPBP family intramembrane glutamic endopeptidase [Luteitalea sp. TBR-22]BCS30929.1 hypothetical protein TBR22_A01300 [Luteitalea sp. TBR-22]